MPFTEVKIIKIKTMKNFVSFFALLLCAVVTSCDEPLDGDWPPIEVDRQQLEFASVGGAQTVTMLNYNHWWIGVGYEDDGDAEYINTVYPEQGNSSSLDGGWYHVTVPAGKGSNSAVVVVDENCTGEPRRAKIEMTVGDAFITISVNQQ